MSKRTGRYLNTIEIKVMLVKRDMQLKELSRRTGIDYDRIQKILHGYRSVRDDELNKLAEVLAVNHSRLVK